MLLGVWLAAVFVFAVCLLRWAVVLLTAAKASRELVISTCASGAVCLVLVWTAHWWMFLD